MSEPRETEPDIDGLCRRIAAGEEFLWNNLLGILRPGVRAAARARLGNDTDADDVTQEVLTAIWKAQPSPILDHPNKPALVMSITARRCVDLLRRRPKRPATSSGAVQELLDQEPDHRQAALDRRRRLADFLDGLPPKLRPVAQLIIEGTGAVTIGQVLEMSEHNAKTAVGRVRELWAAYTRDDSADK